MILIKNKYLLKIKYVCLFLSIFFIFTSCSFFKGKDSTSTSVSTNEFVLPIGSQDLEQRFYKIKIKDKIILVNFWASWCGPCQEEMPSLIKLASERSKDLVLISINGDSSEKEMKKFIGLFPKFKSDNIYIFYDESRVWIQHYAVIGFPETFIYNQKQKFMKRYQGAIDFKGIEFSKLLMDLKAK